MPARPARIARAAAALGRMVASPETSADFDAILRETLTSIVEQAAAKAASAWLRDREGTSQFMLVAEGRGPLPVPAPSDASGYLRTPISEALDRSANGSGAVSGLPVVIRVPELADVSDTHRAYLVALGISTLVSMPIVAAGINVGVLTLHLASDNDPIQGDPELMQLLAAQVALRSTQFAREREAPRARSSELLDHQRRDQLARANRALRETVNSLGASGDLDFFVGSSLRLMAEHLASRVGFVFVLGDSESLRLAWLWEGA